MVPDPDILAAALTGFVWDSGNLLKNWIAHRVLPSECEEVFFNQPVLVMPDHAHSAAERRYALLGRTNAQRLLAVVFTVRRGEVRVISARPMSRKERALYDNAKTPTETP